MLTAVLCNVVCNVSLELKCAKGLTTKRADVEDAFCVQISLIAKYDGTLSAARNDGTLSAAKSECSKK